jgi:hypothetical protein
VLTQRWEQLECELSVSCTFRTALDDRAVRAGVCEVAFELAPTSVGRGGRFLLKKTAHGEAVAERVGDYLRSVSDETPDHCGVDVAGLNAGALEASSRVGSQLSYIDAACLTAIGQPVAGRFCCSGAYFTLAPIPSRVRFPRKIVA